MCGILLTTREKTDPSIIQSISHRGIEFSCERIGNITLCHHRLPIQTYDGDNWNQPIEISPGVFLMFNGEIFNYDKKIFSSDIEYLVHLFSKYKAGGNFQFFVAMFVPNIVTWDGFWAIVIFDSTTGNVIAFTDPLGKKPLYKNELGEICSEMKGLASDSTTLDEKFISSVRKWGYNTDNSTPFTNIKRLNPNQIYHYNINSPLFDTVFPEYFRAWDLPIPELRGLDYDSHVNWLWDKMFESVENRLLAKDYPICLLVSGGLDSSIIAAILKEKEANVTWFSIENGERMFINDLENHLGVKTNYLDYSMDPSQNSYIYVKYNESPIDLGSVIPQYHLFEAVRKKGNFRIVLSGDGSDELFGGYSRIEEYDSQKSDVFQELSYYHLPRLDKMSMAHTLELRNPFLNLEIVRFALHLPLEWRKNKKILKDTFGPMLPDSIINRKKEALKNPQIKKDKLAYRFEAIDLFLDNVF